MQPVLLRCFQAGALNGVINREERLYFNVPNFSTGQ